uniref:ParA family protein n=1 Tax=Eubacterium cellulosolvens TaxID=29322 RepID=UPI0004888B2D|nr:ParA family protein [[Eubacterium] cellulosolvens]
MTIINQKKKLQTTIKIGLFSRKGGVGKTFTTEQLAAFFANDGYKVCIVGCDDQEDLTDDLLSNTEFEELEDAEKITLWNILEDTVPSDTVPYYYTTPYQAFNYFAYAPDQFESAEQITVTRTLRRNEYYQIAIIPAHDMIESIDYADKSTFYLEERLSPYIKDFDIVLFDTPRAHKQDTWINQIYRTCDYAICNVEANQKCLPTIARTLSDINVAHSIGAKIEFLGIVIGRYFPNRSTARQMYEFLADNYNVIGRPVREGAVYVNSQFETAPLASYEMANLTKDIYTVYADILYSIGLGGSEE